MRNVVVYVVACCALKAVAVNAIGIVPIPSPLTSLGTAGRPIAARFNKQVETKEKEHEDHA